jgi:hypothetical protein
MSRSVIAQMEIGMAEMTGAIITRRFECLHVTVGTPLHTTGVVEGDDHDSWICVSSASPAKVFSQ